MRPTAQSGRSALRPRVTARPTSQLCGLQAASLRRVPAPDAAAESGSSRLRIAVSEILGRARLVRELIDVVGVILDLRPYEGMLEIVASQRTNMPTAVIYSGI